MGTMTAADLSRLVLLWGWLLLIVLFARYVPWNEGLRAATAGARQALVGLLLQGGSFVVAAMAQRTNRGMIRAAPSGPDVVLLVLIAALVLAAIWFSVGGARALGRHWAMGPKISKAQRLVTNGPFSWVRHPIYTGLGAMLIASALVYSTWWGLPAALAVYAAGTTVRVRAEEEVLLEVFGSDYETYRGHVAAVFPWRR